MPSWSRIFWKNCAARASLPGGFVVSIRRYSRCHSTARSAYCLRRSGGMLSDANVCPAGAVWDQPSAVTTAKTNPKKQTVPLRLGIQSPVLLELFPLSFYISFAKITLKADVCSLLPTVWDYNVIAGQGVSFTGVWQSTCYRHPCAPESTGADISGFSYTPRQ